MNYSVDIYENTNPNDPPLSSEEQLKLLVSSILATHFDKYLT
jgi:hypothetical protein